MWVVPFLGTVEATKYNCSFFFFRHPSNTIRKINISYGIDHKRMTNKNNSPSCSKYNRKRVRIRARQPESTSDNGFDPKTNRTYDDIESSLNKVSTIRMVRGQTIDEQTISQMFAKSNLCLEYCVGTWRDTKNTHRHWNDKRNTQQKNNESEKKVSENRKPKVLMWFSRNDGGS